MHTACTRPGANTYYLSFTLASHLCRRFGKMQFNRPYVAEVFTKWIFGAHIQTGVVEEKKHACMLEWCNLHEIPINRERNPSGAVD